MTYEEAVATIHSYLQFGIHPGLTRMDTLLCTLGNPHHNLRYVHVAGTNGKGSVSTAVANVLTKAGLRTGLYTSPYVSDFLERIQFCGRPVDRGLFADSVETVKAKIDDLAQQGTVITEFEALTAAAFLCFQKLNCDVVVLEVGLGGRLDATNVIPTPLVNVITSLSLDHTAILGDTIELIAREKCGIIKEGGRVVCSARQPQEALDVVREVSREKNCTLTIPNVDAVDVLCADIFGTRFRYEGGDYFTKMPGAHQILNMTSVIETCKILKNTFPISDQNIVDGIAETVLPARVEVLQKEPLVILDGGHNPDGARAFYRTLEPALAGRGRLTVIAGMMADKAVEESLRPLISRCDRFVAVMPANPRAMKAAELAALASGYCSDAVAVESPAEAVRQEITALQPTDVLCVVGSLYLAGEVRQVIIDALNEK